MALSTTPATRKKAQVVGTLIVAAATLGFGAKLFDAGAEAAVVLTNPTPGMAVVGAQPRLLTQPTDLGIGRLSPEPTAAERGMFGPRQDWPIIAIHAAVGIDGSLTTFGSPRDRAAQDGRTFVTWQPGTGKLRSFPSMMDYNSFCAGMATLADGRIIMIGGNTPHSTHVFDPLSETQSMAPSVTEQRWYGTLIRRPDGRMLTVGGGAPYQNGEGWREPDKQPTVADTPEIGSDLGTAKGVWKRLEGATSNEVFGAVHNAWWYPRAYNAPDGKVFGVSWDRLWTLDDSGNGSVRLYGRLPAPIGASGSSVMYAPGKLMFAGGGQHVNTEGSVRGTNAATLVDIGGAAPAITSTQPMQRGRNWLNLTVLADGKVLSSGGTALGADAEPTNAAEIWNPRTQQWALADVSDRTRTYHSTAALLPSGAVFIGGGGAPGPQDNLNAEIFYPPNLFAKSSDGSVRWASRPAITTIAGDLRLGGTFDIELADDRPISDASLISLSSTTHSYNSDQRRVPLKLKQNGSTLTLTVPGDHNALPYGAYHLTVVDNNGTPSGAQTIVLRDGFPGLVSVYDSGVVVAPAPEAQTATISLGGFEEGAAPSGYGFAELGSGDTFGPWKVTSAISRDGVGLHPGTGASGAVVDLDDDGSIQRTVSGLKPGASYRLTFQTARNQSANGTVRARVDIDNASLTWSPTNASNTDFTTVRLTFTASASTVPLKFVGLGSPVTWAGALIDDPALEVLDREPQATPTPSPIPTPTPAPTPTATPELITAVGSQRCLDVLGGDPADGTRVTIWDCHGKQNQRWSLTPQGTIINQATGKCLDVIGDQRPNGSIVWSWTCHGLDNQRWRYDGKHRLVSAASGRCLDIDARATSNGSKLQIWDCHDGDNQQWHLSTK